MTRIEEMTEGFFFVFKGSESVVQYSWMLEMYRK